MWNAVGVSHAVAETVSNGYVSDYEIGYQSYQVKRFLLTQIETRR